MSEVQEPIAASGDASLARATQFVCQVEGAAAFLKAAHSGERVKVEPPSETTHRRRSTQRRGWYSIVITEAARQLRQIIVVFDAHPARGSGAAAELEAFRVLSELTTAGPQLQELVRRDRTLAVKELARHLELVRQQFEATAELADALAVEITATGAETDRHDADEDASGLVKTALLNRAGGAFSLTEATSLLGVSRQALHKRIAGGSALGMMIEGEIAVPKLQIAESDGRHKILPGIGTVTKMFRETGAGPWMALQFLVDPDPNLRRAPIATLSDGDEKSVVLAARAYLRLDEE